jgi:dipeptidyl aminopeptidase/acylaminoacyl peptidase
MMDKTLDLEALLRVSYVEPDLGFDISPDGIKVAFSWNRTGRWEIYIRDLVEDSGSKIIASGDGAKFAPQWSPQRNQLAYAIDLNGEENYDIYLVDLESGKHTNLTPNTDYAIMPTYAWSPDGEWLAYCSDQDGRFDTYVIPAVGGKSKKVLELPYPDWKVSWSPDGRHLAVVSEAKGQDYWITIVPILDGDPFSIAINGNPICAKDACWSPDGKRIAFASNYLGSYEIGLYEIETGIIAWITGGDGEKEQPDWSLFGKLVYVINYGPRCEFALQDLEDQNIATYQLEPGVIYSPKFSPCGNQITFIFDNPRHPCNLWSFSIDTQNFRQITYSLPEGIDQNSLAMPEEIKYPGLDGIDVPGLLYRSTAGNSITEEGNRKPANGSLPPGVLLVHGGPNWLAQFTWDPLVQYMIRRGWVVMAPNYRGSIGYGKEWQTASRYDFGGVDTEDVVAGADYLSREGIADPEKIAVTGRSWGGYLTMMCLTQYPEKWAAGSAIVPFLNWFTGHSNSRQDLQHWDLENFGDPVTHYQLWYARSPFFFLKRVKSPVQLVCGGQDVRCPASESTAAYKKMIELGKVCEFALYEDEGHSFLKLENLVESKLKQIRFLAKYLEK